MKSGEQKVVKIEAPSAEISSLAIIKLLDRLTQSVMVLHVKFVQNVAIDDLKLSPIRYDKECSNIHKK